MTQRFILTGLLLLVGFLAWMPAGMSMERIWRGIQESQQRNRDYNEDGVQETHGATSRENCRKMAERFKQQGRRVTLVDIIPSSNPGAVLRYVCVFEGPDAQTGWFDEQRY